MASVSPILIASPTRSGTTMIAWLLHLHGVWIGKAGVTKAPETNPQVGTENTAIKEYLKGVSGAPDSFRERMEALTPPDGPWLVKTAQNLLKMDAWLHHYPEARWVLPNRPTEDIVESAMRHPGMCKQGRKRRRETVELHKRLQRRVSRKAKHHHWVDVDAMARGSESEGHALLEFCGLTFDAQIFNEWVQPERWHSGE